MDKIKTDQLHPSTLDEIKKQNKIQRTATKITCFVAATLAMEQLHGLDPVTVMDALIKSADTRSSSF